MDAVDQHFTGEDAGRGSHEGLEEMEFLKGERDRLPFEQEGETGRVKHDGTVGKVSFRVFGGNVPGAAQDGLYTCHEFSWTKGFGDLVIRTDLQTDYAVNFLTLGREEDNGDARSSLTKLLEEIEAVDAR